MVHGPSRQRSYGDRQCVATQRVAPTRRKQRAVCPGTKLVIFLFTLERHPMDVIAPMFRMGFPISVTLM